MDKHTCHYDLYHNPSASPKGEKYMHARLADNGKVGMENMLDLLSRRTKLDVPSLRAVLENFTDIVSDELAQGKFVQIGGLGGFQMTLSCPDHIKTPEDVRGGSISVKSVEYRPDKQLLKELRRNATFRRTRYKKNLNDDWQLVLDTVRQYFADPENKGKAISTKILSSRLDLTAKRASERLHELVAQGILINPSTDPHHPMYLAGPKLQD